ncbi:MAG: DUF502 domain-containing protein [Rhodovibrionaceae bacterium]
MASPPHPGFLARLRNYFFAGVLVTAPIAVTVWVAWAFIEFVDSRVVPLFPPHWNPESYLPFSVPGLGLLIVVLVLLIVGMLTAGVVGRMLMAQGEKVLAQLPVIRSVYGALKQIFETVLAQRSTAFRQVALVEYPSRGIWAMGFVTARPKGEVQRKLGGGVTAFFIPATPNPTTGFLLFVPDEDVRPLEMTVEQGLKLIISGGIVVPPRGATAEEAEEILEAQAAAQPAPKRKRPRGPLPRLRTYLITGILVTAPAAITFWLAWQFVTFVDNRVTPLIPAAWNPESYLPFGLPGLGLVVAFIGLTLAGMLAAGLFGRAFLRSSDWVMNRVPVARSVYGAVKQILETVLARKSKALRECVLFNYPRADVWSIGFITGVTEGEVQDVTESEVMNVFLPTVPNPTSGFLLFVPRKETIKLSMSAEEGLKMVVSGGIVEPPDPDAGQSRNEAARPSGTQDGERAAG